MPTWSSRRSARPSSPAALDGASEAIALEAGRIKVDDERRTSLAGVWAGGDCVAGGEDLTVAAVAGRQARGGVDQPRADDRA